LWFKILTEGRCCFSVAEMDRPKGRTIKDVTEGLEGTSTSVGPLHCFCTCQPQSVERLHEVLVEKHPDGEQKYKQPVEAAAQEPLGAGSEAPQQKRSKTASQLLAVDDAKPGKDVSSAPVTAAGSSPLRMLWRLCIILAWVGILSSIGSFSLRYKKYQKMFDTLQDGQCYVENQDIETVEPKPMIVKIQQIKSSWTIPAVHSGWHAASAVECLMKVSVKDSKGDDVTKDFEGSGGYTSVLFAYPKDMDELKYHNLTCASQLADVEKHSGNFDCTFSTNVDDKLVFAGNKDKFADVPEFEILLFSFSGATFQIFLLSFLFLCMVAVKMTFACLCCRRKQAAARERYDLEGSGYFPLPGSQA